MKLVVIAGPNGAGKSTAAPYLLQGALGVSTFVNADTIARGLDPLRPEEAAIAASRAMLERMAELAAEKTDFAFETTLAGKSFAPWIRQLQQEGYVFHLVFLYLPGPEIAISRVAHRARLGGHDVPEEMIRRRYTRGLKSFFGSYGLMADSWWFYDNSSYEVTKLVAFKSANSARGSEEIIVDHRTWNLLQELYS